VAGPGFFVPALGAAFYTAGKCGAKKGGVDGLGKLRSVSGVILTFLLFRWWRFYAGKTACYGCSGVKNGLCVIRNVIKLFDITKHNVL
jgi:hypothetical protein